MNDEPKPHQKCACSRTRQCALHRHQMRALTRRPQEQHLEQRKKEKVAQGIEALKQRYNGQIPQ